MKNKESKIDQIIKEFDKNNLLTSSDGKLRRTNSKIILSRMNNRITELHNLGFTNKQIYQSLCNQDYFVEKYITFSTFKKFITNNKNVKNRNS